MFEILGYASGKQISRELSFAPYLLGVTVVAGTRTTPDVSDGLSWVRDVSASSRSEDSVAEAVVIVLESWLPVDLMDMAMLGFSRSRLIADSDWGTWNQFAYQSEPAILDHQKSAGLSTPLIRAQYGQN